MMRKIGKEDFVEASFLSGTEADDELPFRWVVCREYEIVESEHGDSEYIQASTDEAHFYEPLTETPDLFLRYARIAESSDPVQALLDWVHKYGLLGFTLHQRDRQLAFEPTEEGNQILPELVSPPTSYSPYGGIGDTLDAYFMGVRQANELLRLYEGALNRDAAGLESLLFDDDDLEAVNTRRRALIQDRVTTASATWVDGLIDAALWQVYEYISSIRTFCFPSVAVAANGVDNVDKYRPFLSPENLRATTTPRNLEGAMYLQMYWLITSSSKLSRCEHCGRIVSLARPHPEGRKRRNDKRFCNDACRQAAHRAKQNA